MKQNHFLLLLFLLFLVTTAQSSARILATKQGEEMEEITSGHSLNQLMGVEDCQTGQEECLKRRMIAEAHLDYIYTQHHKP
ncbi:Phytosulfokine-beta like [Actinidia chinensis var. chinensis]|uniref:Phytosulfokine n=1 Tax=Actinidia chinensis var. chinensis TaxID=1590841 RepID=A0A2R6P7R8_ACTCC|nr:putative phytosulfokines 6 isoform X1 [Actinidia eriantha]PSR86515.1 Phytosulfokine-beta like [Actinidia chinensis var. chinensis]